MSVKRERVPGVPNFVRIKRSDGYAYYFRYPKERKWTPIPGRPGLEEAKRQRNKLLGVRPHERVVTSSTTFAELTEIAMEDYTAAQGTVDMHMRSFDGYLAPLKTRRVQEITTDMIIDLVVKPMRDKNLSGSHIHNTLGAATVVFKKGIRKSLIHVDPVKGIEAGPGKDQRPSRKNEEREYTVLSGEQLGALLAAAGPSYMPIFATMALAGLRISEALGLIWDDVDFDKGQLNIRKQLDRKTRERVDLKTSHSKARIDMSPILAQILATHSLTTSTHPEDFVFVTRNATPYSARQVQRGLEIVCKKAGVPVVVPHELRHTCGSALLVHTKDPAATCKQLRHANPQVTLTIYAHIWGELAEAGKLGAAVDASIGASLYSLLAGE